MRPLPEQLPAEREADLCERIDILLEEWLYEVRHYREEGDTVEAVRQIMRRYGIDLRANAADTRERHASTVQAKTDAVE